MTARAKTINLLLYDGTLGGVISMEDSNWNSGEMYSAPRESVSALLKTDACNKYGVYLLLSSDMVYVGQASDLAKRITQHTVGKDWWESVVILTTKDNSLDHADIDYLESALIEKAFAVNRLDCDNKQKGNNPKVDKFKRVVLEQYLEEALFLMRLIGINVFDEKKEKHEKKDVHTLISTVDVNTKLAIGKRAKAEAVKFLQDNGVKLGKKISYAVRGDNKNEFWVNPQVDLLKQDWTLILNNNAKMEIIVVDIPANTYSIEKGKNQLMVRYDKNNVLDLNINVDTLIDRRSKQDFSKYVTKRVKY